MAMMQVDEEAAKESGYHDGADKFTQAKSN
jgi:hypothetical protein